MGGLTGRECCVIFIEPCGANKVVASVRVRACVSACVSACESGPKDGTGRIEPHWCWHAHVMGRRIGWSCSSTPSSGISNQWGKQHANDMRPGVERISDVGADRHRELRPQLFNPNASRAFRVWLCGLCSPEQTTLCVCCKLSMLSRLPCYVSRVCGGNSQTESYLDLNFRLSEPLKTRTQTHNWFRPYFRFHMVLYYTSDWNRKRPAKPYMYTSDLRSNKASRQQLAHSNTQIDITHRIVCMLRPDFRASECGCWWVRMWICVFYTGWHEIL